MNGLRVLYGLDRFSEDMDFSLVAPAEDFDLVPYCGAVEEELRSWGFPATVKVKGRDWYDLVWYVGCGTALDLVHLEARMRQSGHHSHDAALDETTLRSALVERIEKLDIAAARSEVGRFLTDPATVRTWSREFFLAVAERVSVRD
jgi:hypothetical protein